jgi:WD40 repeat protein
MQNIMDDEKCAEGSDMPDRSRRRFLSATLLGGVGLSLPQPSQAQGPADSALTDANLLSPADSISAYIDLLSRVRSEFLSQRLNEVGERSVSVNKLLEDICKDIDDLERLVPDLKQSAGLEQLRNAYSLSLIGILKFRQASLKSLDEVRAGTKLVANSTDKLNSSAANLQQSVSLPQPAVKLLQKIITDVRRLRNLTAGLVTSSKVLLNSSNTINIRIDEVNGQLVEAIKILVADEVSATVTSKVDIHKAYEFVDSAIKSLASLEKEFPALSFLTPIKPVSEVLSSRTAKNATDIAAQAAPVESVKWRVIEPTRILSGHKDSVQAVVFSPDDSEVVTASIDGSVILWDVASGLKKVAFANSSGPIFSASFSPDAAVLTTGGRDGLRTWDTNSGRLLAHIIVGPDFITGVAFYGSTYAAVISGDSISIWDIPSRKKLHSFQHDTSLTLTAAFSPDGEKLVTGHSPGEVIFWNLNTLQRESVLRTEPDTGITSITLSPDGKRLACGHKTGEITVWDIATKQKISEIRDSSAIISAVTFSPDAKYIAAGEYTRIYDSITGAIVAKLASGGGGSVSAISFTHSGKMIAASHNERVILWELDDSGTNKIVSPASTLLRNLLSDTLSWIYKLEMASNNHGQQTDGKVRFITASITSSPAVPQLGLGLYWAVRDILAELLPEALRRRTWHCLWLIGPILVAGQNEDVRRSKIYDLIPELRPRGTSDLNDEKRSNAAARLAKLKV